ncbi:hypothetical protein DH2020_039511 [Rehmannia glutinosa]|uniref:PGG domain-containing protein n=1 Tax=Rehmannia glutinosa TaxID=99300 RepID=A0ABR0UVL9_REHGL
MKTVEDSHQSWSLPLYKALNQGNWEIVEIIIKQQPAAIMARLTPFAETPLLVAVKAGQGLQFIRKLLDFMPPEALALTDYFGNTALHAVAVLGNIQAARLFVEKNAIAEYLALYLVEHNPKLAWQHEVISPLELLAQEPSAFPSGMNLNIWQSFIYSCVPMKLIEMPESLVGMTRLPDYYPFKPHKNCRNQFLRGKQITFASFPIVHQQTGQYKMSLSLLLDNGRNNILHLMAYRPHQDRLDMSSGAVLRMQRELQWKSKNADGKTPLTIFNEEHRELAANETQWMIGMATSCTVAASLIATVAFAAAITVPGGNDRNGLPTFSSENAFLVFAVSDALALLSSVTTVLSFLSIFTSRYGVNDFLYALPNRLIIGLISLFLSVTSLMMAFSSTMFLVAARKNALVLIPIIALACVPVALFACLQLPPLLNMIKSTYGPSIFD